MIHPEIKPGLYTHYKGGFYKVHFIAQHSESQEAFVVYEHLTAERQPTGNYWVRPASMWFEEVDKPEFKGPRFLFLSDQLLGRGASK